MNRVVAIHPPLGFSQRGQRDNNEDYVLPAAGQATTDNRLFVVCDGVGGAERGEVASLIAAESLVNFFQTNRTEAIDARFIKAALAHVESAFDQAITEETDVDLTGMSTTLTLLSLHAQGVTIAHVGDSRVYHVRDGQILHQTHDHSLVNELLRTKQISPEEAVHHPRRNVITRAIQGSTRPTTSTVYITQDVAAGDYFFMCTDGVLECIDNQDLIYLLTAHALTDDLKIERLLSACADGSRDNYSGYLVRIAAVAPVERPTPTSDPLANAPARSFQLLMDSESTLAQAQNEGQTWLRRLFS